MADVKDEDRPTCCLTGWERGPFGQGRWCPKCRASALDRVRDNIKRAEAELAGLRRSEAELAGPQTNPLPADLFATLEANADA